MRTWTNRKRKILEQVEFLLLLLGKVFGYRHWFVDTRTDAVGEAFDDVAGRVDEAAIVIDTGHLVAPTRVEYNGELADVIFADVRWTVDKAAQGIPALFLGTLDAKHVGSGDELACRACDSGAGRES